MRFEHPQLLWLLLPAVPGLIAFFWWAWRKKRRLMSQFIQARLLAGLTVGVSAPRQKLRLTLLVAAVALFMVVVARPQWGFTWEEARQRGLDVVVAIDTSRSMLAEDVSPNRLARAKLAAIDLKRLARTDRVGLVAFAGTAFLQCPLSFDDEAFRQSLEALDVKIIPQGGTALAEAIRAAQGAFKEKSDHHKVLVIFTDGEDHDGQAVEAARDAAKQGLRIFAVGVGTPSGEILRTLDAKGRSDFIRDDQGNAVKSRLNENLLREVAKEGNGYYMLLTGANTVDLLYERGLAPLPKADLSALQTKRWHERFQWFLGLALLLLIAEMFVPERRRVRRAEEGEEATGPALRRAAAVVLVFTLGAGSTALASGSQALRQYKAGRFQAAQGAYERLLEKSPDDPRLHFNAGAAAYQGKDYESASKHFNAALITPDVELQQRAYYNLGNAEFRLGENASEAPQKVEHWSQATNHYSSALRLKPQDADASYNLDLVLKKLAELPQPPEQQKSKDEQEKKDQDQDKQEQQKDPQQQQQDSQSQTNQNQQSQQQPQEQEQKEQPQPQPSEQEKPDAEKKDPPQPRPGEAKDSKENPSEQAPAGQARPFTMTPQEAQRLLDTLRNEERPMMFLPQIRTNRSDRVRKDW
jgi:Ca-activated chloride channel family protein